MPSLGQRLGLKPVRLELQLEGMDDALRNGLWDAFSIAVIEDLNRFMMNVHEMIDPGFQGFVRALWHDYFKRPLDTIPDDLAKLVRELRSHFFACTWIDAYEFIEFTANRHPHPWVRKNLVGLANGVMERDRAGYRFIGMKISPITDAAELAAVEQAATATPGVREHLRAAVDMLSDRANPDYRNSIKESISAVEAICRDITGNPKATLGDALKKIDAHAKLHPAFRAALDKLYGYASDEGGIRHALVGNDAATFENAKFLLVVCSAFVNYLLATQAEQAS